MTQEGIIATNEAKTKYITITRNSKSNITLVDVMKCN
jgi:hypothetical protein